MHLDVVELRNFYYRTKLGRSAQRGLQEAIAQFWPDVHDQYLLGFGFAAPTLRPFLGNARRIVSLMPSQQGVMHWPVGLANISVLVEETEWPIAAGSVDRMIILHGLETCESPSMLLEEVWRVLAPGGRAIFVVPNRSGSWARRDATPFGFGRPYSMSQLEAQLKRHRFTPERHMGALFSPPSQKAFWLKSSRFWEGFGRRSDAMWFAGVLIAEVSKQVYAKPEGGLPESVKTPLEVLEGLVRPKPRPVTGRSRIKPTDS